MPSTHYPVSKERTGEHMNDVLAIHGPLHIGSTSRERVQKRSKEYKQVDCEDGDAARAVLPRNHSNGVFSPLLNDYRHLFVLPNQFVERRWLLQQESEVLCR